MPAIEKAKTVHALDRMATVIGGHHRHVNKNVTEAEDHVKDEVCSRQTQKGTILCCTEPILLRSY
jgi:hypothetical protein